MKKAFVAILSLAALVGCSRDVIVDTPASAIIQFGDSFVENKTRAEITTSEPSDDVKDFTVWGYRGSNDVENLADLQLVFNRQNVYRNFDENTWEYSPLQYWLPGASYFFAAVSPALRDAEGNERTDIIVTENLLKDGLGTIEFTNTDGSVDLLYDQLTVPAANIEEKVKLQFAHLLAKIKFSFRHTFPNPLTTVGIKNIHYVNSPKTGTIDVTEARTDWAWSIPQNADNTVSLDFGGVENGANFVANTYKSSDKECLVIPSTRTHHVEFDVVIYHNGVEAHTYKKITSQFDYTFVQGKTYNLRADITPDKLDMDAIEFTVVVEDWVDEKENPDFPEEDGDDNTGDNGDENTYKLYLNNEDDWDKVFVYAWDAADEKPLGNWPGTEMTEKETVEGVEYFVYTLSSELNGKTINFLFNNGNNGKQTADIEGVVVNTDYFYTNYVEPTPEPEPTAAKLYLQPNANWMADGARFAAYFFGNGETWVGMTKVETKVETRAGDVLYEVAIPEGYPNVIFCRMNPSTTDNNWNNKWNQTEDLTVPTDGTNLFVVKEGTWDNGGGSWSTYTPAVAEPVALATPIVNYEVEGGNVILTWDAVEGAKEYFVNLPEEGENYTTTETTFTYEGGYECTYVIEVTAIAADTTKNTNSEAAAVTVTTEAEPAEEVVYTTVAEFLAAAEDESENAPMYTLKGTITSVTNTSYGNFDLTDDTGTVLIYGLMSPDGATNKYWATSGAKIGDDIVVKTVRTSFNGTAQGKNAWFVELVSPGTRAFYTVDPAAVDFASVGGEQDIEVFAYNTTAGVTATSDNAAFTVAVNGYVVTVTAAANELEEAVTGNITIKVGDLEPTVVKATLAAKPAADTVEGGSDDFHTISATNTSYVSGKTTAGWAYANCAIFKGGTSDSSPAFKMIGDATNRALCMNGKTSGVGSITSPTLTTGCGTLNFNYGLPFSDNKIKFRVDIIQDGAVVKTFTVENSSAAKYTLYSHEEVINVAGDFQIVFTNLCPSNSTSNKDRTAIWDVEWTGYNN